MTTIFRLAMIIAMSGCFREPVTTVQGTKKASLI
jgi:hypothetical protein